MSLSHFPNQSIWMPQEILNRILEYVAETENRVSEYQRVGRMPVDTHYDVLRARVVCWGFEKAAMRQLPKLLEQSAFSWSPQSLIDLNAISEKPKIAFKITQLTFSGYPFNDACLPITRYCPHTLSSILRKFVNLKHVVYYACPPHFLWDVPYRGSDQAGHGDAYDRFNSFMAALNMANIRLDTFKTPLNGNRGWWHNITHAAFFRMMRRLPRGGPCELSDGCFANLSDLRLNLYSIGFAGPIREVFPVPSSFAIFTLESLKTLEITLAQKTGILRCRPIIPGPKAHMPNLTDFRLMGNTSCVFVEPALRDFIRRHNLCAVWDSHMFSFSSLA